MVRMNPPRLEHLRRLTDFKGLIHAAVGDCPDRFRGYDSIDNADALRLCAQVSDAIQGEQVFPLARAYFEFLWHGRREDGRVHHGCDHRGGWHHGGDDALVQSHLARALAAIVVSELPIAIRLRAADWWRELLPHADDARTPRAAANWLIAIGQLHAADPGKDLDRAGRLARWLLEDCYQAIRTDGWEFCEPQWSTGSACVPEALWYASELLEDPRYGAAAETITRFLISAVFEGPMLVMPGSRGGWAEGRVKGLYDQLPADAAGMVALLCTAERLTGCPEYGEYAELAAQWFAGNNIAKAPLIDESTGGCRDRLTDGGTCPDEGAAAVVAYLLTEASRAARAATSAEPPVYLVPVNG